MADRKEARPTPPGLYERQAVNGITSIEWAALAATLAWLLISGSYFMTGGASPSQTQGQSQGMGFLLTAMVIMMPVALIWVAAMTMRSTRIMREESARLAAAIDAIRQAYVNQAQSGRNEAPHPAVLKRLDEIASTQKNQETTLAMLVGMRQADPNAVPPAPQEAPVEEDQPALSLGTPAEAHRPPLSNEDFIRALHFPETADDTEGFAALRRALKDRQSAQLIQAAQDVLTLMSQDGIYMDDLRPDLARPEVWRAFAQGKRGREIAALGGVRDRSSLALTAGRMKQDPIFRDAAHHFLRRFDQSIALFEKSATDADLQDLAGTRTSRAFMLLGRVAGTFD
ncbi:hypothetical protein TRP8649_00410 [Pelagimonas phthalicica]|uniref:Uncharacterized protein n=1 Tax=Pelagimonas phthalicica TaxID=1037362 RepID=A0A238J8Z5_9RHOB|nr:hypothetical protein [Pelagimonas phthalicica]TDS95140.1 hypothetical protein CLV87_1662 [Pelagimonas phthalicica]SMX26336.1 hypothetical protein TRP8649_00410 [Pelagimonas phthalicica]